MKEKMRQLRTPIGLFLLFILYTICLTLIDVQKVGPRNSEIGFATMNQYLFHRIGVSPFWYQVTEVLGIFPLLIMGYFALRGFFQLCVRKKLSLIDSEIIAMGFLYVGIAAIYVLFEKVVINFRPILIEGHLEASYPSSHTFLAITVLLSAFHVLQKEGGRIKQIVAYLCLLAMVMIIIGRLLSGAHWGTDIFGGTLLGLSFVLFYVAPFEKRQHAKKER